MPGRPLITMLKENDAVGNTDTSWSCDLPKSNYIKAIYIRFRGVNGSSMTEALMQVMVCRVKVESDGGGVIKYLDAQQVRDVSQLRNEMRPDISIINNGVRGMSLPLYFTRYEGDETCLLPAMLFRTLTLTLTLSGGQGAGGNTSFDAGSVKIDVTMDELEAGTDDEKTIKSHYILKETERESKATATTHDFNLPLGNLLRGVLIEASAFGAAGSMRDKYYCTLNNGAKIPYTDTWQQELGINQQQWKLCGFGFEACGMYGDDLIPADESIYTYQRIFMWFDEGNNLQHCIDTALYNDVHIKGDLQATETCTITTLEVVRLA